MAGTEATPTDAGASVDAPTSADDDAKEFDAAFEEFAAVDDTETAPPPDPAEKPADAPAPAEGSEEPAKIEDPPAAPEGAAADIWADATPEQRAAFEAAQQENRSHRGRASFLDIQQAQIAAKQPAAAPAAGPDAAPATDEQFTNFESEYPEVAGPIKARYDAQLDAQAGQIAALEQRISGISDVQVQEAIGDQIALLEQRHPTWNALTSTPEFETWVNAQPRFVQEGFVRNGETVVDGEEAARLMDLYVDQQPAPDPAAGSPEPAAEDTTSGKATRRQRRLDSAVTTESAQAGPGAGPPEGDFDAAFDHFARLP